MKNPVHLFAERNFLSRAPAPPPPQAVNKGLGWLSVGLGTAELVAAPRIAAGLGAPGPRATNVIRAFGARELAAGAGIFHSPGRALPVWSRVAGDALDLAAVAFLAGKSNPRRKWAIAALGFVAVATVIDIAAAARTQRKFEREPAPPRPVDPAQTISSQQPPIAGSIG